MLQASHFTLSSIFQDGKQCRTNFSNHSVHFSVFPTRYAQQARSIVNLAKVNEDPKARLIRELRAEIARLRSEQCGTGGLGDDVSTMQEILDLRKALQVGELLSSFS